jgi:hypothetical protein
LNAPQDGANRSAQSGTMWGEVAVIRSRGGHELERTPT